jgi:hypothetical protein
MSVPSKRIFLKETERAVKPGCTISTNQPIACTNSWQLSTRLACSCCRAPIPSSQNIYHLSSPPSRCYAAEKTTPASETSVRESPVTPRAHLLPETFRVGRAWSFPRRPQRLRSVQDAVTNPRLIQPARRAKWTTTFITIA